MGVPGCTDSLACNYNSSATIDDSSCVYPTSTTTTITACDSYTWLVNGVTYTTSVIDTVIGVNASGCTETNILNLTVYANIVSILSQSGNDILANTVGGTAPYIYQWNTGETSNQITPTANGNYWVIITDVNG